MKDDPGVDQTAGPRLPEKVGLGLLVARLWRESVTLA